MGFYRIAVDGPREIMPIDAKKEAQIEDFLEKNSGVIRKDIRIIGRQIRTSEGGIIDLMGLDKGGNVVIIEIKRETIRQTASQILEYANWAESLHYDDLNKIAKDGARIKDSLYEMFKQQGEVPEPFNQKQLLYIIAQRFDEKTKNMCEYLRTNGMRISCIRIDMYKDSDEEFVHTETVVGRESYGTYEDDGAGADDSGDENDSDTWDDRLRIASDGNRKNVADVIALITDSMECAKTPQSVWLKFSRDGTGFGFIVCNKTTSTFAFRSDPNAFDIESDEIRDMKRWFFDHEKRIAIIPDNFDLIVRCARHAYGAAAKIRRQRK